MSVAPLVSPGTRFDADELNTTKRPSALTLPASEKPLARSPASLTETRSAVPA
jgi:hypothetical protein